MAHAPHSEMSFYNDGRRKIAKAAERLEDLRAWAEKSPSARRNSLEPRLDEARGLLNRARAQLEAVRIGGGGDERSRAARAAAAVDALLNALDKLENPLSAAA